MPVYEEVYRSWNGRLIERPRTWWVIARTGARLVWRRVVAFLLILAYIPFMIRAAQIIIVSRLMAGAEGAPAQLPPELAGFSVNAEFFADFLTGQTFFLVIILVVGAGLIANDRKFKALPLYFSKPVGFWDYLGGKLMIVVGYGALITLVPALLLFATKLLFTTETGFVSAYWWVIPSIVGWTLLAVGTLALLLLALSAVARGPRPAAIYFFTALMLPELIRQTARSLAGAGLISPLALISQTASLLFGSPRPYDFSAAAGLVALLLFAAAAVIVLWTQVRPTEVVR